jgi:hypothetical protein
MNELLLTPGEICNALNRNHRTGQIFYTPQRLREADGISTTDIDTLLQAQFNKVLNPPKLDKPDGEGWRWFSLQGKHFRTCQPAFVHGDRVMMWNKDVPIIIDTMKVRGTWQRALVPE